MALVAADRLKKIFGFIQDDTLKQSVVEYALEKKMECFRDRSHFLSDLQEKGVRFHEAFQMELAKMAHRPDKHGQAGDRAHYQRIEFLEEKFLKETKKAFNEYFDSLVSKFYLKLRVCIIDSEVLINF